MINARCTAANHPLTNLIGLGLRSAHYQNIIEDRPEIGWLEIHPENYFGGGENRYLLREIANHYKISFHCTGLSLGAAQAVSQDHLAHIKSLCDVIDPIFISDHASWSASGNAHLNDLLPLPYTRETLDHLCRNINTAQDALERRMLIENPSTYLMFKDNEMDEATFMIRAAQETGCGLLLDLNNIYVQSQNHGFDAHDYLRAIPPELVGEIHLAGHKRQEHDGHVLLIDTHNDHVAPEVWTLYRAAIARFGAVPTLIEWDQDLPPLSILLTEAEKAQHIISQTLNADAHHENAA